MLECSCRALNTRRDGKDPPRARRNDEPRKRALQPARARGRWRLARRARGCRRRAAAAAHHRHGREAQDDHHAQPVARHRLRSLDQPVSRLRAWLHLLLRAADAMPITICRRGWISRRRLFAKPDAPALLRAELAKRGYVCQPIAFGTNTDPYQPIEAEWRITRGCIEVLAETRPSADDHHQVRPGDARHRPARPRWRRRGWRR